MAPRLFHIAFAAALSAACLLACHRKEDTPEGHTPSFTVNGKSENFTLQLLATGQTASLQIQSSEEWSVRGADDASWLAVSQPVQEKEHQWTLGLSAEVNEQEEPRQARLVFTCDTLSLTLTLQQDALDPMLRNPVPGFYGTEGGDLQLDLFRHQSSLFDNGEGTQSWRVLDLSAKSAAVLSGIPSQPQVGQSVALRYKYVENGFLQVYTEYPEVTVFHVTEDLLWLRKDAQTYFIVER